MCCGRYLWIKKQLLDFQQAPLTIIAAGGRMNLNITTVFLSPVTFGPVGTRMYLRVSANRVENPQILRKQH
jgi:hypothetical protein